MGTTTRAESGAGGEAKALTANDRMALLDKIELRRFVGRELLLWLWFESELFEATLSTKEHGQFGFWLEGRLILSEGHESTIIKGSAPGQHREAKESLLRGKTPERAGLHLSWGDKECTLALRGDSLAFAGLSPPGKKSKEDAMPAVALAPPPRPRKRKGKTASDEAIAEQHDAFESFYDRMHHAKDVEDLMTALYRDFLALRLSSAWDATVLPALEAWVRGDDVDERAYRGARTRALA
jgi:hypothetical protein